MSKRILRLRNADFTALVTPPGPGARRVGRLFVRQGKVDMPGAVDELVLDLELGLIFATDRGHRRVYPMADAGAEPLAEPALTSAAE